MNIEQFMKTVYLGDRFLKEIVIDSYNKEIKLKINLISRIRNSDGIWNNYNDENIQDGYIVFSDVQRFALEPEGVIPNDEINDWECNEIGDGIYEVSFNVGSYNSENQYQETKISLRAKQICLEDSHKHRRIYE